MRDVDVIVIGSGQGGVPFAVKMSYRGKRTALIERSDLGGSCVNFGCTPSKAFLGSAQAIGRARHAAGLGAECRVKAHFGGVMARVRDIRDRWRQSVREYVEDSAVELVRAEARFVGERTVEAGGEQYRAPLVLIDTGRRSRIPPIEGLQDGPYLSAENFFELTEMPDRTAVLGAGYVGLELGQGLARLGSRVTIIDRADHALVLEEPQVGEAVAQSLKRDGIDLRLKTTIERVRRDRGKVQMTLSTGGTLEADAILVAAGRAPNTEALDLARTGVETDEDGCVRVNQHLETACEGVYAIGDVAGQPPFTHVSWEDHRRVLNVLDGESRRRDDRAVGYAVFTDPQVGRAGLTLDQARRRGLAVREVSMPVAETARGIEWGQTIGFYRVVVEEPSGRIIGATLVGDEAGELVSIFLVMMEGGDDWRVMERTMNIHPTYAEGIPILKQEPAQRELHHLLFFRSGWPHRQCT